MTAKTIYQESELTLEHCPLCGSHETTLDFKGQKISKNLWKMYTFCHNCGEMFPQGPITLEAYMEIASHSSRAARIRAQAKIDLQAAESHIKMLVELTTAHFDL